jgi:hypothetical protein
MQKEIRDQAQGIQRKKEAGVAIEYWLGMAGKVAPDTCHPKRDERGLFGSLY